MNNSNSYSSNILPDYFPYNPKECRMVGSKFFECFSKASEKKTIDDTMAGIHGLEACMKEKKGYEQCMNVLIAKESKESKANKRYRVQEEYRKYTTDSGTGTGTGTVR